MPRDRLGNRYLVNFVNRKSNYCRVFLAKTKDQAAKKFEHFLAFFRDVSDARYWFRKPMAGEEYRNVDLFCKRIGVARQFS